MKRITLYRPVADNAGGFQDAGSTLTIGDTVEPGVINAAQAQDLVDGFGAVEEVDPVATPVIVPASPVRSIDAD